MIAETQLFTKWMPLVLLVVAVLVWFWMTRPVSVAEARRCLQAGAKVVDVRSKGEFASGAVKGAINIPLDELSQRIKAVAPDPSAPVLVHCLSGGRSGVARRTLRSLGYQQVHNLGSLDRARRIVEG